jgi:integrase
LQQKKREGLAPQTLNHLRGHLRTAINAARRAEQYTGPNPVSEVRPRRVPKRKPAFPEADEVPRMLAEISPCWRPLFATAVYTGLRKGELIGLRKKDVDLKRRLLTVERPSTS